MALVEAYFDETGTSGDASHLCIAGYLFEKTSAQRFDVEWRELLNKHGLSHFHATEFMPGNGEFSRLTKDERSTLQYDLIQTIKRNSPQAVAVAINNAEFEQQFSNESVYGRVYTTAAYIVWSIIDEWAARTNYVGDIAYFFERGHDDEAQAGRLMSILTQKHKNPNLNCTAHSFLEKKSSHIQAADLLAWHLQKDLKNRAGGRERRKDTSELLSTGPLKSPALAFAMLDGETMRRFANEIARREALAEEIAKRAIEAPLIDL